MTKLIAIKDIMPLKEAKDKVEELFAFDEAHRASIKESLI